LADATGCIGQDGTKSWQENAGRKPEEGASFKTLRTYRLKEGPGTAFFHEHDGECPKIQKYALKELKMPIFGNTSPSVYSTHCFFMKSNMLFVIAASGISASL
jgi:hypothetical protein